MAELIIDGRRHRVEEGQNLLAAVLSLGIDLPYFCWHPALGSVGSCRQCAVKRLPKEPEESEPRASPGGSEPTSSSQPRKGEIVMACMTPAADGTRIAIDDAEARAFRAAVIEWLMVNHPHDCAVCDEGGECHLQDMTVMTGHHRRRYRFTKRTHRNQDLGPFIHHEMNRCIACYRCVRFYRDHAGGRDLDVFGAHDDVFFGRAEDGALESRFAGNLVEVCPTGVFTDRTLRRHYARKWDLMGAPSVCVHCSVGCNVIAGARDRSLRRIRNRYHHDVNGWFLCDRGRFGYEFVNGPDRVRRPLRRAELELVKVPSGDALAAAARAVAAGRAVGIGSPRASLESNHALRRLVGRERFVSGMGEREHRLVRAALDALRAGPALPASLRDVREADAVLLLGEDPCDTAPMLGLALRQAARNAPVRAVTGGIPPWHDAAVREAVGGRTGPFFVATPALTDLDDLATEAVRAAPDDAARLGFAVARALDAQAPEPAGLAPADRERAERIARALAAAERPVVVAGTGAGTRAVIEAAASVARALVRRRAADRAGGPGADEGVRLALTVPECDSLGAALLAERGLDAAIELVRAGGVDALVIVENDLYRRDDREAVDALLAAVPTVVVIDHTLTDTALKADVVLPAATFAEGDGTLVSAEGRAQRFTSVIAPEDDPIVESWRWLRAIAGAAGRSAPGFEPGDDLGAALAALAREEPALDAVTRIAPPAGARFVGQPVPRAPHRMSGRTASDADRCVREPTPPPDPDAAMSFSMEGLRSPAPASLVAFYHAPGWSSVQSAVKRLVRPSGPQRDGDPGIRVLDPPPGADPGYGDARPPAAFAARADDIRMVVALPRVFGGEELSARAPAVADRSEPAHVALRPEDADRLGVAPGARVAVAVGPRTWRLPVRLRPDLAAGLVGITLGGGELGPPPGGLPAWGRVSA